MLINTRLIKPDMVIVSNVTGRLEKSEEKVFRDLDQIRACRDLTFGEEAHNLVILGCIFTND